MSDDYSSFERDYFKKSKRRQDFKQPKISPKHIKVYEPKSAQKSLKTQGYADEPDYSPRYEDDYYDDYITYSKGDTYKTYISKTASSSKSKQGGNNRSSGWKKEVVKTKKGNGECQKAASPKEDIEWVVSPKTTLFLEGKTATANNSNPKTLPVEAKHSSGEESSNISAGLSTAANTEERRSSEMFDFSQDRPDPIQAMKAMMRKGVQGEEKIVKKEEEGDRGKESTKDESNIEVKEESEKVSEDKEIGEEVEENNYSDIDGLMEKKILNNEIEINSDEDVFNEGDHGMRKQSLEELENEERPLWEDLDTNKMLEDIKKFDHLPMFSKDLKASWRDNLLDGPQGNKEKKAKDIWEKDRRKEDSEAEEDDDDFEKFFSLKICDDIDDVVPNIFHIWHKASSDKQARGHVFNESKLMKSQSFDSEIIKRKDSHTPLPAFKNHRIQEESMKDEQQTPNKGLASGYLIKAQESPSTAQKSIFKALIPNYDAKVWCYRDLQGNVQGPFSGKMMDDWFSKGYLPLELDITIAGSNGYRKLRELADVAAKTESQSNANNNSFTYNNNLVQPNKNVLPSQYPMITPGKVLPMWGQNQDNMNRDHGNNLYNKGNGILPGQFLGQNMVNPKQSQPTNLFSNMIPLQQTKMTSNEYLKNNQNDSNDNNKRSFQNVVTENQCPNMGNFNIFASNIGANNVMTSNNKTVRTTPQAVNQAQIQLSYPVFNPQFENYKGMNGNQVINSSYRPQQMMNFNQVQGFGGSKVEANSNQLRNLPR